MSQIKIISDTSADFTKEEAQALGLTYVPFTIDVNGATYVDDDTLDLSALYRDMQAANEPIRTGCPSPYQYKEAIENAGADEIFIVTITSKLSGSYNAAQSAVAEVKRDDPNKKIALIDSKSASAGTANVVEMIARLAREGKTFDAIEEEIKVYVDEQNIFFILESMDNLIKNGRIPKLAGKAVNVLNMKPIMRGEDGSIGLFQINRGFKKSLMKLAAEVIKIQAEKGAAFITISHSRAEEKAKQFQTAIQNEIQNATIRIVQTKGLSSVYADRGGIVVAL
ncbi:MAG: DegV family protein [Peptoniphilus sp.]|nr:DegV family protein [Peptoniphilus sp.]MDY3118183.1 DegV family protein [Peptoniphilus sp.]